MYLASPSGRSGPAATSKTQDGEASKREKHKSAASIGIDQWPTFGDGRCRFFRADQLLDWLAMVYRTEREPQAFIGALNEALDSWLIPVDPPLVEYGFLLDRRTESRTSDSPPRQGCYSLAMVSAGTAFSR